MVQLCTDVTDTNVNPFPIFEKNHKHYLQKQCIESTCFVLIFIYRYRSRVHLRWSGYEKCCEVRWVCVSLAYV